MKRFASMSAASWSFSGIAWAYHVMSTKTGQIQIHSTAASTVLGHAVGGRRRPIVYFGGSVDDGTGPGIIASFSTFLKCAVCDFVLKGTTGTTLYGPSTIGGTFAQYLASKSSISAAYSAPTLQDVLHYDLWGSFSISATSTSSSYPLFYVSGNVDCVYELGSSTFPVTQADLDGWAGLTYWARQTSTGRIVLVLYTAGGAELTVPEHTGAADLVVVFKDAATRTVAAFHARYDFATNFNTSTTADPRPDLSAEGVVYQ